MYKDLEIVIVSMLQIGADNHCFQINHINKTGTDHSHKTEEVTYL